MNLKNNRVEAQGAGNAVTSQQNLAITIFTNESFGDIRTAGTADEPLFCLADICRVLELTPSKVAQRLDKDVLSKHPLSTAGGLQNALFVNEDGLYDVILDSRKPEAKAFRKWITAEVLPQIRMTGGYIPVNEQDDELTIMAKALRIMQRTLEEKDKLIEQKDAHIDELEETIGEQKDEIRKLAPKAEAFDKMTRSDSTYTARQLAKEFGYSSPQALYKRLIELKVLFHQSNTYMPYKDWADKGFFSYRTHTIERSDGSVETHTYLVFTEKFRTLILRSRHRRAMESI
jgi:prophage antirepressor-like protein